MTSLERACDWFWQRATRSTAVSPGSLGLFRWCFGLSMLVLNAPYSAWIDQMPRGLFDPPVASPAYFAPAFAPFPTFLVLDTLELVALLCLTIGYRTRWASIAYVCLDIFTSNFRYSFGKLDRDFLPAAAMLCMLLSDWHKHYSLDARLTRGEPTSPSAGPSLRDSRALALLSVLVAFGMFSAGLPKLVNWVDFDLSTSGILTWYLSNFFGIGRTHLLAPLVQQAPHVALELSDYLAPLGELMGFVALLWSRRAWLAWLAALVGFHLMNDVLLNIYFTSHVLVYLAFVDFEAILPALRRHQALLGKVCGIAAALAALVQVAMHVSGVGGAVVLVPQRLQPLASLYASIPVCLAALALFALAWKRPTARNLRFMKA